MKFNNAYSQMFPGYPRCRQPSAGCGDAGLNRHTVGELIRSAACLRLKSAAPTVSRS